MNDGHLSLILAAAHEAGHGVAAEDLTGHRAHVHLTLHRGCDGATWWQGRCTYVQPTDSDACRLVALVGPASEALAGPGRHDYGPALISRILRAVSHTDAVNAGHDLGPAALQRAIDYARRHWPLIRARALREAHQALLSTSPAGAAAAEVSSVTRAMENL